MTTLLNQLQLDATEHTVPVSALLRRVKLVALKLGVTEVEAWVEDELNGYSNKEPPDYRLIHGSPKAFNPYQGWIPMHGAGLELLSQRKICESASALEKLIADAKSAEMYIEYPHHIVEMLDKAGDVAFSRYALHFQISSAVAILDKVRNFILDWAINLERAGIVGTESNFDDEDKKIAQSSPMTVHIAGDFIGNLGGTGNVVGSVNIKHESEKLISMLSKHMDDLANSGIDITKISQSITEIKDELSKQSPNPNIVSNKFSFIKGLLSKVTENVIASGILYQISKVFS